MTTYDCGEGRGGARVVTIVARLGAAPMSQPCGRRSGLRTPAFGETSTRILERRPARHDQRLFAAKTHTYGKRLTPRLDQIPKSSPTAPSVLSGIDADPVVRPTLRALAAASGTANRCGGHNCSAAFHSDVASWLAPDRGGSAAAVERFTCGPGHLLVSRCAIVAGVV